MKKTKFTLFLILIVIFCGCQQTTNQTTVFPQTQQMPITKIQAVQIAEKFIADQKKDSIGEVFPNASGAKFTNNRWLIGFTYMSHFQEEELKVVSMDSDGSNMKVQDHISPKDYWLDEAQPAL